LRFPGYEEEWDVKELGNVAEIARGKSKHRPRDAEFLFGGEYPFIQTGDIRKADIYLTQFSQTYSEAGLKQSKLWDENTLCITIAANIAETAILKIKACFPDSVIGLIPKENETTVLFVKHLFDRFKVQIQSLSQGVAQDNLNQEKLSKIKFSFPKFAEQQQITNFLTIIDERISSQSKIIKQLETLIKGLYEEIFENEKYQFSVITLKSLCFIKKGEQINSSELSETGLYYVMNGGILPSGYHSEYNSDADTISISEGGNSCGYVQYNNTRFWSGGHCYTLNKIDNTIINKYLYHYLKANENKIMALRIGSGLPNIQKSTLEKFEVKIPNFYEQEKVVLTLDSFSNKLSVERKLFKMYQQQKQYFLQKLFI
jgi:type I restriction enzyme S subunit